MNGHRATAHSTATAVVHKSVFVLFLATTYAAGYFAQARWFSVCGLSPGGSYAYIYLSENGFINRLMGTAYWPINTYLTAHPNAHFIWNVEKLSGSLGGTLLAESYFVRKPASGTALVGEFVVLVLWMSAYAVWEVGMRISPRDLRGYSVCGGTPKACASRFRAHADTRKKS